MRTIRRSCSFALLGHLALAPTLAAAGDPPDAAPVILLAQAKFLQETDESGVKRPKPGPARVLLLRERDGSWQGELLEDADSNVFHKAAPFADGDRVGLLTIGGTRAALKHWTHGATWTATTLWQPSFGGKWDRLRDFEIADVTGDREPDILVATHDQGVVAVVTKVDGQWQALELDRKPQTFVHEIETGDLDGDGTPEIFATPSAPNRVDGTPQPGVITVYRRKDTSFERGVVAEFPGEHVKEILVADMKDDGTLSLLASLEGESQLGREGQASQPAKVHIKQYHCKNGAYTGKVVATLNDDMCRFLNAGDVDGDGKPELIASTRRAGVWLIRPSASGEWRPEVIDKDSGGFEHATALADLDNDGRMEVYVAADNQRKLRRYRWDGGRWDRADLTTLENDTITFGLHVGTLRQ